MISKNNDNRINKIIPYLFWVFAVLYFANEGFIKPSHSVDDFMQTLVAYNITNGNGFALPNVDINDLSVQSIKKFFNFAPGYSLLISTIINQVKDPASINHWVIFLFSLFSLYFLYKLLIQLSPNSNTKLVYITLFFVVVSNAFQGGPTDLIAIALFLASILVFSKTVSNSDSWSYKNILLLSFLCFLLGFFRYAYYPICFTFVACFLVLFLIKKDYNWLKSAVVHGVLVGLMLLPQLIAKIYLTEQLSIMKEDPSGMGGSSLNFMHLLYVKPVFFSAFFDEVILYRLLGYEGIGGYDRGFMIPMWLRLGILCLSITIMFILIFFGINTLKIWYKKRDFKNLAALLGLSLASGLKIAFLMYIAVSFKGMEGEYVWTLAMVGRYYNIVYVTVIVLVFLYLVSFQKNCTLFNKIAIVLLVGVLLLNTAHKVYLSTKFSLTNKNENINLSYPPKNLIRDSKDLMVKIKNDNQKYAAFIYKNKALNTAEKVMLSYISLAGVPTKGLRKDKVLNSSDDVLILSSLSETELKNVTPLKVEKLSSYKAMGENYSIIYSYKLYKND